MKQYVVTISPVPEDDSTVDATPQMIVRIDVTRGGAHVVELTVRASTGADLATGQLPSIDLERLAQVFGSPTAPGAAAVEAAAAAPAASSASSAPSPATSGPAARPTRRSTARPSRRPVSATETRAAADRDITSARAYRRMPDPDELRATYSEIGSIAGVAKHYGVPTHTAQGWIGRLRRLGSTAT